jgi:hypothetical protein
VPRSSGISTGGIQLPVPECAGEIGGEEGGSVVGWGGGWVLRLAGRGGRGVDEGGRRGGLP